MTGNQWNSIGNMIDIIEDVAPNIILGIEEFKTCIEQSRKLGKWEAWKRIYFERFKGAFQPMLDIVYQDELESLKPFVEALDFDAALSNARSFVEARGVAQVCQALDRATGFLPPLEPFPVYLIIGIGHANGMALPAPEPYMFIGLEMTKCQASIDGLVAHEDNHLYRVQAFYRNSDPASLTVGKLTVGEFTISEGLATVFPLVLLDQEISATRIAECLPNLGDPKAAIACKPEMHADLLEHWDQPATREMITRFIESGVAYFVGGLMIARLLEDGYNICELTRMPTEELSALVIGE